MIRESTKVDDNGTLVQADYIYRESVPGVWVVRPDAPACPEYAQLAIVGDLLSALVEICHSQRNAHFYIVPLMS